MYLFVLQTPILSKLLASYFIEIVTIITMGNYVISSQTQDEARLINFEIEADYVTVIIFEIILIFKDYFYNTI